MKVKIGAALLAAATIVSMGAISAAAEGSPVFGCYHQRGSLLFEVGSPGTDEFQANKRDCHDIDKYGTHVARIR